MTLPGPVAQVGGGEQGEAVVIEVQHHHPAAARLVPEYARVAIEAGNVRQHRIVGMLAPGTAAVVAVRQTLRERPLLVGGAAVGGIQRHQRRIVTALQAAGVVPVDDRRPGVHGAVFIGYEGSR